LDAVSLLRGIEQCVRVMTFSRCPDICTTSIPSFISRSSQDPGTSSVVRMANCKFTPSHNSTRNPVQPPRSSRVKQPDHPRKNIKALSDPRGNTETRFRIHMNSAGYYFILPACCAFPSACFVQRPWDSPHFRLASRHQTRNPYTPETSTCAQSPNSHLQSPIDSMHPPHQVIHLKACAA
jgi:hypothetical protein